MNKQIQQLLEISKKENRKIIGLMSGTSLDGLDIALCDFKGAGKQTEISLIQFETIPYSNDFKEEIKSIFSKRNVDLEKLCLLNEWIAKTHAEMINKKMMEWQIDKNEIDLIASHGQTIYHAPVSLHQNHIYGNGTLQIGDGDHLAFNTGIITISDFRQKHIAAGGEGAPLAAYGDYLLYAQKEKATILINIGGISNLSFIPKNAEFEQVVCTDIGPGNHLMDTWVSKHYPALSFDTDAILAKKGTIHIALLKALKSTAFFKTGFPKTTGPELFNLSFIEKTIAEIEAADISFFDVLATLNKLSVDIICHAIHHFTSAIPACDIFISGGGVHNSLLIEGIKECAGKHPVEIVPHADAKEAILFALLANELVAGEKENFGKGSKSMPAIGMGKICLPG